MNTDSIPRFQALLDEKANPKTKAWWEKYLKGVISFRGVKMADTRITLHKWLKDENIFSLPPAEQKDVALSLIRGEYTEDKMAGILFFQEVLIPSGAINWKSDLPHFAELFQEGYIYDWNTCDWFCVKVLGPLAQREGQACARAIAHWKEANNLWQRRAAGVAFVNFASKGDNNFSGFTDMLLDVCSATVKSEERFAQTGTGWVLRELDIADHNKVLEFVESHIGYFSSEGLRYATEKMTKDNKASLRKLHKEAKKAVFE